MLLAPFIDSVAINDTHPSLSPQLRRHHFPHYLPTIYTPQEKEKEAVVRRSPQLHLPRLVCNSLLVVLADTCVKESMQHVWELVHQFTLLLSLSTCVLRSWNWLEMLPVITRRAVLSHVTSPWLSRMMKN